MVKAPKHLLIKIKAPSIKLGKTVQLKPHTPQKVNVKAPVQKNKRRYYEDDEAFTVYIYIYNSQWTTVIG